MKKVKVYVVIGYDNIDIPVRIQPFFRKEDANSFKERLADLDDVAYAVVHERTTPSDGLELVGAEHVEGEADGEREETEEGKTL